MTEETDLIAEFSALAEQPAPPSAVDVHEALRRGRSRLRRRRAAVLATATAVVVSAVALAAALPGSGGRAANPAVLPSTTPTPPPSGSTTWHPVPPPSGPAPSYSRSPAPLTGNGTDPLVVDGRFGWLPDSVTTISYTLEAGGGYANAQADPIKPDSLSFHLTVFPAGVTPALPDLPDGKPDLPGYTPGNHAIRVDAPPVNGRQAYWVSASDPNFAKAMNQLRWQTADGRWAQLDSGQLSAQDAQQVPLRVAAGVTTGHWQVPLPVRITDLPKEFAVDSVTLQQSSADHRFSLRLGFLAGPEPGQSFSLSVEPEAPPTPQPTRSGSFALPKVCRSANGLQACVSTLGGDAHLFDPAGSDQGFLGRLTLLGADPSGWNTAVLS